MQEQLMLLVLPCFYHASGLLAAHITSSVRHVHGLELKDAATGMPQQTSSVQAILP